MDTSNIIKKIAKLQLEQYSLITELLKCNKEEGVPPENSFKPRDHIIFLTGSARSNKGDKAIN